MKKSYIILGLLFLAASAWALFSILNLGMSEWKGWTIISSIAALFLSICIVFAMRQYVVMQRKEHSLEQAKFVKSLADEFSSNRRLFLEAWPVLREYTDVPQEMDTGEWHKVVAALRNCYESTAFLSRVAQLVKDKLIERDLLYLFYYDEIIDNWTSKLRFLIQWCGTGLDLAANYDSYDAVRVIKAVKEVVAMLNIYYERRGGHPDGFNAEMERFEERVRDFLTDPSKFDVSSDNYVGNYEVVPEFWTGC